MSDKEIKIEDISPHFLMVFLELVRNGTWANIGPYAGFVYVALKYHVVMDLQSPSISELEISTGLGRPAIIKALNKLTEFGLVESVKEAGKKTDYRLIERFFTIQDGAKTAEASFMYSTRNAPAARMELQDWLKGIKDAGFEHLTVNVIQQNHYGSGNNYGFQDGDTANAAKIAIAEMKKATSSR